MTHELSKPFVLALVENSEYHSWWGEKEIRRYIDTPMGLGQYIVFCDDDFEPIGYASWGFPNERQIQKSQSNNEWLNLLSVKIRLDISSTAYTKSGEYNYP